MKTQPLLCVLTLSTGLAGCFGGDDTPMPAPSNEVPASATASPTAYSEYAGSLAATDSAEPLDVDKVVPPTSETDEPIDVS